MQIFKLNKYRSAGLISVSIHIVALVLGSSWVIHNKKETREEKKVIINVRLEKPKKPKVSPPTIIPAKKTPIVTSYQTVRLDQFAALPVKNISNNSVTSKIPTKLITQPILTKAGSSTISPLELQNTDLTNAVANSPSEIIDGLDSRIMTNNIQVKSPVGLHPSKQQPGTGISSIRFHKTNFDKASTKHPKLNPKMVTKNNSSLTKIISSAIWTSNQNIRLIKQNNQPKIPVETTRIITEGLPTTISKPKHIKIVSEMPSPAKPILNDYNSGLKKAKQVSDDHPYTIAQAAVAIPRDSSPYFNLGSIPPSQYINSPKSSNSNKNLREKVIITRTLGSKFDTRQSSIINSNIDSKHSTLNKVIPRSYFLEQKSSPKISVQSAIAHKNNNVIKFNSKPRLASIHKDMIKPIYPSTVVNEDLTQLRRDFNRKIRDRIAQVKSYPIIARRRGFEGQPVVSFTIGRNGTLMNFSLSSSSGHKILDKSALETVKKAVPYPKIPDKLNMESIKLKLPISYNIK